MQNERNESLTIEILHGLLILLAYSSPLWMDWRVIVVGSAALLIQFIVFKNCLINLYQYKNTDDTYYTRNLRRFNIPHDPAKIKLFFRYWMLVIIPIIAIIWQVALFNPVSIQF